MHIQLVTFTLDGISDADLRGVAETIAPQFAALPGLQSKVWLADPATNTYGGVYAWKDRHAMQEYLTGETYAAMRGNPAFTAMRSRDFGVIESATRITGPDRVGAPA